MTDPSFQPLVGKFRGVVTMNVDPERRGRLRAKVPGLDELSWALPAVPYAGKGVGLFLVPPVGANVWIEFEGGQKDYPVWSGCFWESGECPASPPLPTTKVLKTDTATVTIDDIPGAGGVTVETKTGMKVKFSATKIEVTNGTGATVEFQAASVRINGTALEVT